MLVNEIEDAANTIPQPSKKRSKKSVAAAKHYVLF